MCDVRVCDTSAGSVAAGPGTTAAAAAAAAAAADTAAAATAATAAASSDSGLPPLRTGRSVWRGDELAGRRHEWELTLSEAEVAEVEAAVAALLGRLAAAEAAEAAAAVAEADLAADARAAAVSDSGGGGLTAAARRRLASLTPDQFPLPSLGPRLKAVREELLHGRGFVLMRRLPVERYSRLEAAAAFLGIGCHLGCARSQNARGHVLGHVADLGLSSADPRVRIYQTAERQSFHTDSCDVVGLLCLQEAASGGDSLLVSADTLFNELHTRAPHLLKALLTPMPHDRRGEVPAGQLPFFEIPVFSWHEGHVTVFYQKQYFLSAQRFPEARRLSPEEVEALEALDALADSEAEGLHLRMRLAPGDLQWVHNHNMLHDRTAFADHPEPHRRRHLLRLWLAAPGARPLPPAFAARYGSLEVGRRGGIEVPGMQLTVPLAPE